MATNITTDNVKSISDLTAISSADIATDDLLLLQDVSASTLKKVTASDIIKSGINDTTESSSTVFSSKKLKTEIPMLKVVDSSYDIEQFGNYILYSTSNDTNNSLTQAGAGTLFCLRSYNVTNTRQCWQEATDKNNDKWSRYFAWWTNSWSQWVKYVKESSVSYSENETRIGTWIDGQPLYRKVVNVNYPSITAGSTTYKLLSVSHGIQNISKVCRWESYITFSDGTIYPLNSFPSSSRSFVKVGINKDVMNYVYYNWAEQIGNMVNVIEYTKSTD